MSNFIKNKQILVTSPFDLNNHRLTNLSNPLLSTDAVNLSYVDSTSINYAQQTGLYSGGTLQIVDSTHFRILQGTGFFVDSVSKFIVKLEWNTIDDIEIIPFGATDITISVGIDSNGNVIQQIPLFTESQRREYIVLGQIFIHPNDRIAVDVAFNPIFSKDTPTLVDLYVSENDKSIFGNTIYPNGNNLLLNCTSGKMLGYSINAKQSLENPNISTQIAISGITMYPTYYNGTEWIYLDDYTSVDVTKWSNGTSTLQNSTNNKFHLKTLFRSNGIGDVFFICYPTQTTEYQSISDAESDILKINVPQPPELFGITVPIAWLIVKGSATNLSLDTDCKIVPIKNVTTTSGALSTVAEDVTFDNSGVTNITSLNVQDVVVEINNKIESTDFASSNQNMTANSGTSGTIYLATNTLVGDTPYSRIKVYVNGMEVEVGNGVTNKDCYFSNDSGASAKTWGDVQVGDSLYWNGNIAPYQLENSDKISYEYLTR